jgi:hypothetical protein
MQQVLGSICVIMALDNEKWFAFLSLLFTSAIQFYTQNVATSEN